MTLQQDARRFLMVALVATAMIGSAVPAVWMVSDAAAQEDGGSTEETREGGEESRMRQITPQNQIVTVTTDRTEYRNGDAIIISGKITTNVIDTPIILQVFTDVNPVYINQITPAGDNSYWDIVKTEGAKWAKPGEYEVSVRYGPDGKATTEFTIVPGIGAPGGSSKEITGSSEVDAGSETFDVKYAITGGVVEDMTLDWRDFTLLVDINVTSSSGGSITMELPRKYIGAERTDGSSTTDEVFIVLIDDVETSYDESPRGQTAREITINFLEGDSEIAIIGTYAVPEFEHMVVVMAAIAGVMLASVMLLRGGRYGILTAHYGRSVTSR